MDMITARIGMPPYVIDRMHEIIGKVSSKAFDDTLKTVGMPQMRASSNRADLKLAAHDTKAALDGTVKGLQPIQLSLPTPDELKMLGARGTLCAYENERPKVFDGTYMREPASQKRKYAIRPVICSDAINRNTTARGTIFRTLPQGRTIPSLSWIVTGEGRAICLDSIGEASCENLVSFLWGMSSRMNLSPNQITDAIISGKTQLYVPDFIEGVTLLDKDEYEKCRAYLPLSNGRWWLKTEGGTPGSAMTVYPNGDVYTPGSYVDNDDIGVRPALKYNESFHNFYAGEKVVIHGLWFTAIPGGKLVADESIGCRAFNQNVLGIGRDFENSDIKQDLEDWMNEKILGRTTIKQEHDDHTDFEL